MRTYGGCVGEKIKKIYM